MKKYLFLFFAFALINAKVFSQLPDLPSASTTYDPQILPAGSYVIGMDNTTQANGVLFNLKAYGLVVHLLNSNIRVRWVIRPAKLKDEIDFSVVGAQRMITSATSTTNLISRNITISAGSTIGTLTSAAGVVVGMKISGQNAIPPNVYVVAISGNNITLSNEVTSALSNKSVDFDITNVTSTGVSFASGANYDFRSGPFVIFQQDTAGVAALVAGFNQINTTATTRVNVYKTTAPVNVDVRYDYKMNGVIWKPRAAILDDGGNASIHEQYMINAGISGSNGFVNWSEELTPGFVTQCYTFASEPHNTSAPDAVISGIRTFVENGGNFLAQCAAVRTYELSTLARFQSTNGFDNANENKNPATTATPNGYLGYNQINGDFEIGYEGGSLQSWRVPSLANGNPPLNNFHTHTSGTSTVSGGITDLYTNASVSKLRAPGQLGGLVFYLGSHNYDGTNIQNYNGQRRYMNALLTPTNPQGSLVTAASWQCSSFGSQSKVNVSSSAGPLEAYPLTFKVYEDFAPSGIGGPDVQLGSTVTITAPGQPFQTINTGQFGGSHNYYVLITPQSSCLQPIIKSQLCSILPVEFMSFSASRNLSIVNLKWTTGSEQNNKGFEIERLLSSGDWSTVGFVASHAPNGNSSTDLAYTFADPNNYKGISQYRLKQIDLDAKYKFSEIRSVRGLDQKGKTIIYPIPSNGIVNIVFEDENVIRDISIADMSGRVVNQWKGISGNNFQINNLLSGMYSLKIIIRETGEQSVEKIIVNRR